MCVSARERARDRVREIDGECVYIRESSGERRRERGERVRERGSGALCIRNVRCEV